MWCAACRLRGGVGIKLQQIAFPELEWSANNTTADDWLTVQLTVCCVCSRSAAAFHPATLSCQLQRPWPTSRCHYDTGSRWCVPLLYGPICRLQCYLEAASSCFDLFDVLHQWRTVVSLFYSHNLFVVGRSVSVLVSGKLLPIPIRNRYRQYRPIPDTRYRYRSQPISNWWLFQLIKWLRAKKGGIHQSNLWGHSRGVAGREIFKDTHI